MDSTAFFRLSKGYPQSLATLPLPDPSKKEIGRSDCKEYGDILQTREHKIIKQISTTNTKKLLQMWFEDKDDTELLLVSHISR